MVEGGAATGEVGAGAEAAAGPGDDHRLHFIVGVGGVEGGDHVGHHARGEGVQPIGPVEGDGRDAVLDGIEQGLEGGHADLSLRKGRHGVPLPLGQSRGLGFCPMERVCYGYIPAASLLSQAGEPGPRRAGANRGHGHRRRGFAAVALGPGSPAREIARQRLG